MFLDGLFEVFSVNDILRDCICVAAQSRSDTHNATLIAILLLLSRYNYHFDSNPIRNQRLPLGTRCELTFKKCTGSSVAIQHICCQIICDSKTYYKTYAVKEIKFNVTIIISIPVLSFHPDERQRKMRIFVPLSFKAQNYRVHIQFLSFDLGEIIRKSQTTNVKNQTSGKTCEHNIIILSIDVL